VNLQANVPAASGWLAVWKGCDSVLDNQCTVNMNANKNVSVEFIQPVYRRHHPTADDWLYSLNKDEAKTLFTDGGMVVFYVYRTNKSGRMPLNRCRTKVQHFLSNTANCEGYTVEPTLGYVAQSPDPQDPSAGQKLLQRARRGIGDRHFTGTSIQVFPRGYTKEVNQGYVPK
jgi:hypothetical protein